MQKLKTNSKEVVIMNCGCPSNSLLCIEYPDKWIYKCSFHDCTDIAENIPNLENKKAFCSCGKEVDSNFNLSFFKFNNEGNDTFYCGCKGWN